MPPSPQACGAAAAGIDLTGGETIHPQMNAISPSRFECSVCGSPSVLLPEPLSNEALVRCRECKRDLGTWRSFRGRIAATLRGPASQYRLIHILGIDQEPRARGALLR